MSIIFWAHFLVAPHHRINVIIFLKNRASTPQKNLQARKPCKIYYIILPINVDITIITNENVKEFTEISVALCSDGIISFNRMSVRTSRKSSAKEPANPPRTIRYGLPENVIPNADNTPIPLKITYFLYFQFGKYPTTFAPSAAPKSHDKKSRSKQCLVQSRQWRLCLQEKTGQVLTLHRSMHLRS